jgi:Holliday junction DNA helicase RuvA
MYEYLEGTMAGISPDTVTVDVGGIGFKVAVAKSCVSRLTPIGQKIKVWVEFVVREDAHLLYGFMTVQDRDFFRLLQHVNGVGPKTALAIISSATAAELSESIIRKDSSSLTKIPGIGKKMAERFIIELHEKVEELIRQGMLQTSPQTALLRETMQALETLGFSAVEAKNATVSAHQKFPQVQSVASLVQRALMEKK